MAQGSLSIERATRTDFRDKRDERNAAADKRRQERRGAQRAAAKARRTAAAQAQD